MSTASTIIIKKPVTGYPSKFDHLKEYSTNLIAICLWGVAAIVTAANLNISPNATGNCASELFIILSSHISRYFSLCKNPRCVIDVSDDLYAC